MTGRPPRRAPAPVQRVARATRNGAVATRELGVRAVSGDKPMAVAFLAVFVASLVLLSGPMQSYLASRDRVELLQAQAEALAGANASLEQRSEDLNDPAQLELRARRDGFIKPGEVPYVVVPPEVERPQIVDPVPEPERGDDPWFVRAWRGLTSIFGE